jgi:hypothetical protein
MATLNPRAGHTGLTTHEGAPAKRIDAEAQLRRSVMACLLWEDQFYEGGVEIADRIASLVHEVNPMTVAGMAIEAREQMHLRHVPLLLVRELARNGGGKVVGDTLARVIQRADELAEFVAIYWKDGKEPLAAQVKRGLAEAFTKFDAYQLGKYNRDREVKLRDVLFLCHAKPKDEDQAAVWKRLVDGTLEAPDTWEVALSSGEEKQAAWNRLLKEQKLGGLALLRNLRNMQQADVKRDTIRAALNANPFKRVLPFRFVAAALHAPEFEPELEQAMLRRLESMDKLGGRTALVVDHSGSMDCSLSQRSTMTRFHAAAALGMSLRELSDDIGVYVFGATAAKVPSRRGFGLFDVMRKANVGHSTMMELGHGLAKADGYDRVIVVSDEQSHQRLSDPLPGATGYMINVASYQNGIGYDAWNHIDGWSEGVLRYIQETEATT